MLDEEVRHVDFFNGFLRFLRSKTDCLQAAQCCHRPRRQTISVLSCVLRHQGVWNENDLEVGLIDDGYDHSELVPDIIIVLLLVLWFEARCCKDEIVALDLEIRFAVQDHVVEGWQSRGQAHHGTQVYVCSCTTFGAILLATGSWEVQSHFLLDNVCSGDVLVLIHAALACSDHDWRVRGLLQVVGNLQLPATLAVETFIALVQSYEARLRCRADLTRPKLCQAVQEGQRRICTDPLGLDHLSSSAIVTTQLIA